MTMQLKEIYRPIEKELVDVEKVLKDCLRNSRHKSIFEMSNYLISGEGKKLRPALVLLSAKATHNSPNTREQLTKVASAMELIHIASLMHDDVIDHSQLRHNRPTVNCKWGEDVAITLGDYLYSTAFELISSCNNLDVLQCISSATKAMCEGELLQVCERDNLNLLKERYILIVKKKTAAIFAASCQSGVLLSNPQGHLESILKEYGLNFGIAFQIIDDYLDLVGEEKKLGKDPGQDLGVGEMTLPLLNLLDSVDKSEKEKIKILLNSKGSKESLGRIKSRLIDSEAPSKTKAAALSYISLAKEKIDILSDSPYKDSLLSLADFIGKRGFNA